MNSLYTSLNFIYSDKGHETGIKLDNERTEQIHEYKVENWLFRRKKVVKFNLIRNKSIMIIKYFTISGQQIWLFIQAFSELGTRRL